MERDDADEGSLLAGQIAGLIKEIKPARIIYRRNGRWGGWGNNHRS